MSQPQGPLYLFDPEADYNTPPSDWKEIGSRTGWTPRLIQYKAEHDCPVCGGMGWIGSGYCVRRCPVCDGSGRRNGEDINAPHS